MSTNRKSTNLLLLMNYDTFRKYNFTSIFPLKEEYCYTDFLKTKNSTECTTG